MTQGHVYEEQSRTRGSQSGVVEDQPQCPGMWHSSSPSARSLSRSPSPPPPSFTQSPSPPRSLVRDGQTSPHRPWLVVSRSTCPPLSPSPHANSFIIGTAVLNVPTHTLQMLRPESRGLPFSFRSEWHVLSFGSVSRVFTFCRSALVKRLKMFANARTPSFIRT